MGRKNNKFNITSDDLYKAQRRMSRNSAEEKYDSNDRTVQLNDKELIY